MVITIVRMKNVLEKYGFMVSRKSLCLSQVTHQAGAYPSICSIKRLALLLIPPGWDANPSHMIAFVPPNGNKCLILGSGPMDYYENHLFAPFMYILD